MFKIAAWNIRGLNETNKQRVVRELIGREGLDICGILETKVASKKLVKICDKVFGNWRWISNIRSCRGRTRIILGWNSDVVNVDVLDHTDQVMHCFIRQIPTGLEMFCSFVYASNKYMDRRFLWESIVKHKGCVGENSWAILGDFNVGLNPSDKEPGNSRVSREMADFRECLEQAEVFDVNQTGVRFTWIQKMMETDRSRGVIKKLDRVLVNDVMVDKHPRVFADFLPFNISDHSPATLNFPGAVKKKPKSFKFNNHLASKPGFLPAVKDTWDEFIDGTEMFSVTSKLKKLKSPSGN